MTVANFALFTAEQQEALAVQFEADFGTEWEVREGFGDRFLSEWDFAPDEDTDTVSNEDMEAWLEMTFVDPAERDLG